MKALLVALGKLTVSFWAFYVLLRHVPFAQLREYRLQHGALWLLASAIAVAIVFCQAWRWHHVLRALQLRSCYRQALLSVWSGHFLNNVLPTSSAGDLLRSYSLKFSGVAQARWLSAFIVEKYAAWVSALCLAALAAGYAPLSGISGQIKWLAPGLLLCTLLVVGVFGKGGRWPRRAGPGARRGLRAQLWRALRALYRRPHGQAALLYSLLINAVMCLLFYILARALGAALAWSDCLFVVPLLSIMAALPISYGGWGVREVSGVALLSSLGVPPALGLALTLLYGVTLMLSSLPGLFSIRPYLALIKQQQAQAATPG
jgi:uncharacterized membrane protein YbhN (UPF0104 family)